MDKHVPYKSLLDHLSDGVYFTDPDRKILFWNKGAEQITGYKKSEMIGRSCWENPLHLDEQGSCVCKKKCPLLRSFKKEGLYEAELFLSHKKGHKIPVAIKTIPVFNRKGEPQGAIEVFSENSRSVAMKNKLKNLESMALVDPLTGVSNRRHLDMVLRSKFNQKKRYDLNFGIIFLDIDNFKETNDAYGHIAGDKVLRMVARNLLHNSRSFDTPGRWGGEEFVIISDNINKDKLVEIAERLRMLVEASTTHTKSGDVKITISVGATLAFSEDTPKTLIERADKLMYQSKKISKNRVTVD